MGVLFDTLIVSFLTFFALRVLLFLYHYVTNDTSLYIFSNWQFFLLISLSAWNYFFKRASKLNEMNKMYGLQEEFKNAVKATPCFTYVIDSVP